MEPALEEQMRADLTRRCLHSVLSVLPNPEGECDHQEVLPCVWGAGTGCRTGQGHWCGWPPISS